MKTKTAILERGDILSNRVHKLNIIRNDIYPNHFNRINRLIIKTERKVLIIKTERKVSIIKTERKVLIIKTERKVLIIKTERKVSIIKTERKVSIINKILNK